MAAPMRIPPGTTRRIRHLRLAVVVGPIALLVLLLAGGAAVAQDPEPSPSLIPGPPAPTPIAHPGAPGDNQCYACHISLDDKQQAIAQAWEDSIHGAGGVSCADCHGGDPRSDQITVAMSEEAGFIGVPSRDVTVGICGSCHSDPDRMSQYGLPTDQYSKYWTSVHGQRLLEADDTKVAICIDCHGSHTVKKASDPTSDVYPLNVPGMCARCHSDPTLMESYGIPTDQYDVYEQSIHGQALIGNQDVRAPSCTSCHGSHSAQPPRSAEVVDVCGKCHTATQELYLESRHAELETAAPKCWTCHGDHDVAKSGEFLFFHPEGELPDYDCTTCHQPPDMELKLNVEQFTNPEDRRCDTCHHPESLIYPQVEAIAGALAGASEAQTAAEEKIDRARGLGMLVDDAENALAEAHTAYVQGQAAVHTTLLTTISGHTDESVAKANRAEELAQGKLDESDFRRLAMVIVIGLIVVNALILFVLLRRIERDQHQGQGAGPSP